MCFLNKPPFTWLFSNTLLLLDVIGCHILSDSLLEVHWALTWHLGILPCPPSANIGLNLPPLASSGLYRKPLKYPAWQHHGCEPFYLSVLTTIRILWFLYCVLCFLSYVFFLLNVFMQWWLTLQSNHVGVKVDSCLSLRCLRWKHMRRILLEKNTSIHSSL